MSGTARFRLFALLGAAAMAATTVVGPGALAASASSITCQEYQVPVTVPAPGMFMAGELCIPHGGSSTVMVLDPP
jgi:hypothetical protein